MPHSWALFIMNFVPNPHNQDPYNFFESVASRGERHLSSPGPKSENCCRKLVLFSRVYTYFRRRISNLISILYKLWKFSMFNIFLSEFSKFELCFRCFLHFSSKRAKFPPRFRNFNLPGGIPSSNVHQMFKLEFFHYVCIVDFL